MLKSIITKCLSIALIFLLIQSVKAQQKPDSTLELKIDHLLKQLTLEEKINMIHANSSFTTGGVARLGIPELTMSDGPHGLRPEHGRDWILDNNGKDSSTYLPVGLTLASTWNPLLAYQFGAVLGSEAKFRGKDIILGPGINIIRTPLNGRNFEYMSEDPYLISRMAVGYIKGVQDQGISACVKHFLANNQETRRSGINVLMSERALREIYLPGFKAAVINANVNAIMGSYNKFRGEYCTYNPYLVNTILKKDWNFQGLMISDWGAIHTTKAALLGGADIEMGSDIAKPAKLFKEFYFAAPAFQMLQSGEVQESIIDDKVKRILRIMFKTNLIDAVQTSGIGATKDHAEVAKRVAEEGIILLKNQKQILPFTKSTLTSIAVIGANADRETAMGGGSSQVRPKYEVTALEGLKANADPKLTFLIAQGYQIKKDAIANLDLINEAVAAAKKADVAIIVAGWIHGYNYNKWNENAYDAEGTDKENMKLPFGQDELISAVIDANPKTIVVLFGGGAMDISKWQKKAKAILLVGYPGLEGGNALAEIIFGSINPSAKLTYTWPEKLEDSPAHKIGEYPGDSLSVNYKEDIFIGYRYFDTYGVKPQFAFGHGLSYTKFDYSNLKITKEGEETIVKLNLKNAGKQDGAEVVQIYIQDINASEKRPKKELKAFEKVFLKSGESKTLTFRLPKESFKYFSEKSNDWILESGNFEISIAAAADNRKLKKIIAIKN